MTEVEKLKARIKELEALIQKPLPDKYYHGLIRKYNADKSLQNKGIRYKDIEL